MVAACPNGPSKRPLPGNLFWLADGACRTSMIAQRIKDAGGQPTNTPSAAAIAVASTRDELALSKLFVHVRRFPQRTMLLPALFDVMEGLYTLEDALDAPSVVAARLARCNVQADEYTLSF